MEKVYPRVPEDRHPAGLPPRGRRGPRRLFPLGHRPHLLGVLGVDHGILLRNAVAWATNEEPRCTVTGPGVLDVTAWRQKASMTVHLVNLTNPMMMKGPFRELIPVGPQEVVVTMPEGKAARKVQLLVADREVPTKQEGNRLTLTVPSILDHEVVAIDL